MRILAIDTALGACAACIVDRDKLERLRVACLGARARRGAPALDRPGRRLGRARISRPRPHRRNHRPWQLHGPSGRDRGSPCDRSCSRRPGARRHDLVGVPGAAGRHGRKPSVRRRHRCAPRPSIFSGHRARRPDHDPALPCNPARCGAPHRGRAGDPRGVRRAHGRSGSPRVRTVAVSEASLAPDILWVARLGWSPIRRRRCRSRSTCARRTPSHRTKRGSPGDERLRRLAPLDTLDARADRAVGRALCGAPCCAAWRPLRAHGAPWTRAPSGREQCPGRWPFPRAWQRARWIHPLAPGGGRG